MQVQVSKSEKIICSGGWRVGDLWVGGDLDEIMNSYLTTATFLCFLAMLVVLCSGIAMLFLASCSTTLVQTVR